MTGGDQLRGEQSGAAAKFEHQTLPGAHGCEQVHDPRSARGGVEPETPVVHRR
jgi:hypothetical protein